MGKANTSVNQWLRDNHRFASLYNGYVFGGRQIIRPEELEDLDRETDILVTDKAGKTKAVGRRRDIVKRWKNTVNLAILACESQDKIHYAMPVRCMLYDGLTYTDQIRELWRTHHKSGEIQGKGELTTEEFLSRFRREDFIYPILTLVFYYDEKKWDGATDLYGMFPLGTEGKDGETGEVLRKYVPNYRMNLIDAGHMEEAELQRLSEDLQQVLGMLKYRGRRKELQGYIQKNEKYFSSVDAETYQALCSFLNMEKGIKEVEAMQKEERVNMCQALEEWYQDALKEGEVKGREAGLVEGRESGRGEGIALAKKVFRLSAEGRTEAEIAKEAGIGLEEVRGILE